MSKRLGWTAIAICVAMICVSGCGAAVTGQSHSIVVSILAPSNGASVGERDIVLAGTVTPSNAKVLVGGVRVRVVDGSFKRALALSQPRETITVVAHARGYRRVTARTTVRYSPKLAAKIVAGLRSQQPQSVDFAAALPPPPQLATATPVASAPAVAASSPSPGQTAAPTQSAPSSGGQRSGGSGSRSSQPLTASDIRTLYLRGCDQGSASSKYGPYCRCTYTELSNAGALSSRPALQALIRELDAYARTHDFAALPSVVRDAIDACFSKLPPLTPLSGRPVITKLPGQTHAPIPAGSGKS